MTPSEKLAYESGVRACRSGHSLNDCPSFEGREHLQAAWEDGYDDCLATGTMKANLMSGKPVFVPHGTPLSCDPSSETYWSM